MHISYFSKEELIIIESFLESSNTISNIYDKLYHLKITGQKNSYEYNQLLDILKEAIKEENKKYQAANLTLEQKLKIIELLSSTPNTLKIEDINTIINQNDNDKVQRRIINILINQVITNIDYTKDSIPKEIFEFFKSSGIPINNNQAYKEINNYSKIQLSINNDIIIVFLAILQETLNISKNNKYQKQLIKALYTSSFINKDIEKQLIENKFDISTNIYISSKFINDLLNIDHITYDLLATLIVENQIITHIKDILKIKDAEYENSTISMSSIIGQCYIRALLTFINDDQVYELNEQFHKYIETPTYLEEHQKDKISEQAIMNCFKSIKFDRTKKRIISFKKNN